MKHPLVAVALWYGGGLLAADFLPAPLGLAVSSAVVAALLTLVWSRARVWLLALTIFLAGFANLRLRTAVISPYDLRTIFGQEPADVTVLGQLAETPYQRVFDHEGAESWRTIAQVEVTAVRQVRGEWQPAAGTLAVSTPGILPANFWCGQTVQISGILQSPKGPLAKGLFDYRTYLQRLGIYYQLQVLSTNDWELLAGATAPPLADRFLSWAQRVLARGMPCEDESLRLLWTMTLGWKTGLNGEVAQPFMRSGTMHVFAISGLHIALIAGLLVSVLRVFKVSRGVCGVLVVPLIWFYTGVTGWQASAIRSTIMMTVIITGWSLRRPSDLLNSLAAAAFIILLWDPQQLFQASFQLSFFVVLSLALFTPVLNRLAKHFWQPDPLLPDELRPRWQRWGGSALRWLCGALATSLAAWLGSMPLIAYYFHLFTPVSLVANLIVVPLSSLALACNLASLMVGAWWPAVAELFNHSAWLFMSLMVDVSQWASDLPGGVFYIAAPTVLTFVLYYAVLISVMAGWLAQPKLRGWLAGTLAALTVAWIGQWHGERQITHVSILPLKGGDAIYVQPARGGEDLLIDCGDASSFQFLVQPLLRSKGVNHLSFLLLTHGDVRHIGAAEEAWQAFEPRRVCLSAARFRSANYRALQEKLAEHPQLLNTVQVGSRLGPWTVLHPATDDRSPQADDSVVVLYGEIQGTRILLMSDLSKAGQSALLQRQTNLLADIVVSGVPGKSEPLSDALLAAIQPRVVVITDAQFPANARASPALRQRLRRLNVPVLYTSETGVLTLDLTQRGWRISGMNRGKVTSDTAAAKN